MQETCDGFGEFAWAIGVGHREGKAARQAMTRDAVFLEKMRTPAQSVLRKNRITKARFDEALDGFRVVRFHNHAGRDANFFKIAIDDEAHVAAFGIEKKRHVGEFGSAHRTYMAAADFVRGRSHDEEFFVKKGNELEVGVGDGKGNKCEIETAVENASDHFFSDTDGDPDFSIRVLLSEFTERAVQLVDESGDARGEMKWVDVLCQVVHKGLLDLTHHGNDLLGEFGEAQGGGSGDEAFSAPNEKLRAEFGCEIVKLQADRARRQVDFFRCAGHAGRIHDRKEKFELVDVHLAFSRQREP